ncbi:reverse transcriptase, partial [Phytophthora megakarya]
SFWSPAHAGSASERARHGGVGILVNPYGAVRDARPWKEELWTAYRQFIQCTLQGEEVLVMNLYAPSDPRTRKQYFNQLQDVPVPDGAKVIAGGDFNCVIDRTFDRRTSSQKGDAGRAQLQTWIERSSVVDAVEQFKPRHLNTVTKNAFAGEFHTYFYNLAHGQKGSSRIDRWYISTEMQQWVRSVEKSKCPLDSDHYGVTMHLQSPKNPIRIKRDSPIYPMSTYVTSAATDLIATRLAAFSNELCSKDAGDAPALAAKWDQFKGDLCKELTQLKRQCRRKVAKGFRQRIRRVMRKLRNCEADQKSTPFLKRVELLNQLKAIQTQRRNLRRKRLTRNHTWRDHSSSKFFFRRICTRFGDNIIHQLTPSSGNSQRDPSDKINILADAWLPIMNKENISCEEFDGHVARMKSRW